MNKRDLRKALDAHASGQDDSSGRRLAYIVAIDATNGGRIPRALREPLHAAAMACLTCDAFDNAPLNTTTKAYPDLYREREQAFVDFGNAAVAHYRRKRKPHVEPEPATDPS